MNLQDVKIENFRGISFLHLPLDKLTVLIGENNTGKSTVLEAVKFVLNRSLGNQRGNQFTEYDFHLRDVNVTPQTAQPILITLHFAEENPDEWPDAIIQQMNEVIQLDSVGLNHIWLQAKGIFNPDTVSFETKWGFLNSSEEELSLRSLTPINLISRFVPLFFLSALRDASQEFGQRGQFWKSFLKSIQIPDDERAQIEGTLEEVNTSVIDANIGLTQVIQEIAKLKELVPLASNDPVVLEAFPTRIFDMVGKIQVYLKSTYGAKIPLHRHGEGTQSLAVLMLFQAFVASNLAEAYTPESSPILALEEPEAHLHPSAICSLGSFLKNLSGKILVSSHSGDLLSRVPITSLRRLYKVNGATKVGQVQTNLLDAKEMQAIDYSICLTKGQYLFSRCWLLVEGKSDFHLMPLLLDIMGFSQDEVSLSVLEISEVINKGEPFIKLAKALGIQWFMMADGDSAGMDYVNRAANYLEASDTLADRARQLTHADIEHEFWHNGYSSFITNIVPSNVLHQIQTRTGGKAEEKIKEIIKTAIKQKGGKPAFAQALALEIRNQGKTTIPQTIQDVITRTVQLARG
ncbi:hypothetical protein NIES970_20610 [[Synechococcus] sp. NIES-970]|nr:hypothetical protein NIES970_20610 [[Synechococcus] sp. NIES-970]